VTKRARAKMARAMMMGIRVASNKEGKGGKAMAKATKVMGKRKATVTKRESGEEQGDGKGSKSNNDGEEEGNGKEDYDGKQWRPQP
jgi:hypothetical protein